MGRFLKNKELKSGSYSIRSPYGSSAVGPDSPVDGLFRYNSTVRKMQYYTNNNWYNIAIEGPTQVIKDLFIGNSIDRTFGPMSVSYNPGDEIFLLVFIGNVFQNPNVAFTVLNDTITFTSTPDNNQPIVIIHGLANNTTSLY
jgi:hypothetical protein